ncbi:phycobilisome rod-core linker polypeptide [Pleurocapsales cyanobacterium LEGE 06147]|nr:phycobilisome rod-core linker polypeptide [Pleurocapsales cyanobacterium LEGE 06147]
MINNFMNPVLEKASELGVSLYEDSEPVELFSNSSQAEIETVIGAVYRQILGNVYIMESERLTVPESQFKLGKMSVREFVRHVAKSELYRSRFFDTCPRYCFIELNFKHLLGRAPESHEEISIHSRILDKEGYDAEIDSYLDSDEYVKNFGENIVPYYRGYKSQIGKKIIGFPHLFQLLRGAASSDKNPITNNYARLNRSLFTNRPSAVIPPSSSISTYGGMTDVNKLLAEVLKPKPQSVKTQTTTSKPGEERAYSTPTQFYTNLEQQYQEQALQIQQLQQRLAQLSPVASIGAAQVNKWQGRVYAPEIGAEEFSGTKSLSQMLADANKQDLQLQVEKQQEMIAKLERQIAEAQSLAFVGEARLNKWRSRVFF